MSFEYNRRKKHFRKWNKKLETLYLPVHQIMTTVDTDTTKWKKYMKTIELMFKQRSLPDFSSYDEIRYLKMNRNTYKYDEFEMYVNSVNYSFKLNSFELSDHQPIHRHGIFSWNVLHHYSYNGSNHYIDTNVVRHLNL